MMSEPLTENKIDLLVYLCKRQRAEIVRLKGRLVKSSCDTLAKSPAIRACRRMSGSRPPRPGFSTNVPSSPPTTPRLVSDTPAPR
jgi:hypothetical protein